MKKSKFIVVETTYHRRPCGQPTAVESNYSRACDAADPPYDGEVVVNPRWQRLDSRWITEAAVVLLSNPLPRWRLRPTAAEEAAAMKMVVVVGFEHDGAVAAAIKIRPGESCRFEPASLASVHLACPATVETGLVGRCRVTVIGA